MASNGPADINALSRDNVMKNIPILQAEKIHKQNTEDKAAEQKFYEFVETGIAPDIFVKKYTDFYVDHNREPKTIKFILEPLTGTEIVYYYNKYKENDYYRLLFPKFYPIVW